MQFYLQAGFFGHPREQAIERRGERVGFELGRSESGDDPAHLTEIVARERLDLRERELCLAVGDAQPSGMRKQPDRRQPLSLSLIHISAMPEIILLDSWPSTVRLPCQISIAEVSTTPAL